MRPFEGPIEVHLAASFSHAPQGTPAAIRAFVQARQQYSDVRRVHLWSYDQGPHAPHQREAAPMRSGPSFRKLREDLRLTQALRKLPRRPRERSLVAHHVEAALAAHLASQGPWLWVAHTDLASELPSYLPRFPGVPFSLTPMTRFLGKRLDRFLLRHAPQVAAVAPALCSRLEALAGRPVPYVPVPWPPKPASPCRGRDSSGSTVTRLLYAGNMDAYQGLDAVVRMLVRLGEDHPQGTYELMVLTTGDTRPLLRDAREAGVGQKVRVLAMGDRADRAYAYRQATMAVVPRAVPGGVSVKLLDALARGLPAVAMERAVAGLPLGGAARVVGDTGESLAAGVQALAASANDRGELSEAGPKYVRNAHNFRVVASRLEGLLGGSVRDR